MRERPAQEPVGATSVAMLLPCLEQKPSRLKWLPQELCAQGALTPTYASNCAVGFLNRGSSIEAIDVHRQYAEVDTGIDPLRFRLRAGCSECEEQG